MHTSELAPDRGASAGNFRLYQFCRRLFIEGIRRTNGSGGIRLSHAPNSGGRGFAMASRIAVTGLLALGTLAATAMLSANEARAQNPTLDRLEVYVARNNGGGAIDQASRFTPTTFTADDASATVYAVVLDEDHITNRGGDSGLEPALLNYIAVATSATPANYVLVCRGTTRVNGGDGSVTIPNGPNRSLPPATGVSFDLNAYVITAANVTSDAYVANTPDVVNPSGGAAATACDDADNASAQSHTTKYTVAVSRALSVFESQITGATSGPASSGFISEGNVAALMTGTVGIAAANLAVNNPPGGTSSGSLRCTYILSGTATYGTDYFFKDGTRDLTITELYRGSGSIRAEGRIVDPRCTVGDSNIRIMDDDVAEDDETIILQLVSVENFDGDDSTGTNRGSAMIIPPDTITLTILDDDSTDTIARITQSGGAARLLANSGSGTFDVRMENFTVSSGFLAVRIRISGDGQDIPLGINAANNGIGTGAGTCVETDQTGCAREFDSTDFTISLDDVGGSANPAFFLSSGAGNAEDFFLMVPSTSFDGNGDHDIAITVTARDAVGRRNVERVFSVLGANAPVGVNAEGFRSAIGTDSGATIRGSATFTIVGPPPTEVMSFVAAPIRIAEDGGSSTVTLTLNETIPAGDDPLEFTYAITGINAADITGDLSGTITVPVASDNVALTITAMQDADDEINETMTITLGALPSNVDGTELMLASGYAAPTVTIDDDDGPSDVSISGGGDIREGETADITIILPNNIDVPGNADDMRMTITLSEAVASAASNAATTAVGDFGLSSTTSGVTFSHLLNNTTLILGIPVNGRSIPGSVNITVTANDGAAGDDLTLRADSFIFRQASTVQTGPTGTVPGTEAARTVTFTPINDSRLETLSVTGRTLSPTFNRAATTQEYSVTLPDSVTTTAVVVANPTDGAADTTAVVEITGDIDTNLSTSGCIETGGATVSCTINGIDDGDEAVVTITVDVANGDDTVYIIRISHRPDTADSALTGLAVTGGTAPRFSPAFMASTRAYNVLLSAGTTAVEVQAMLSTDSTTGNNRAAVLFCDMADMVLTSPVDRTGTRTAQITGIDTAVGATVDIYVTAETVRATDEAGNTEVTCVTGDARARDEATVSKYTITFSVTQVPTTVTVTVNPATAEIREDGGEATITVRLNVPATTLANAVPGTGAVIIAYGFAEAAATDDPPVTGAEFGIDYECTGTCSATGGTVTIAAGVQSASFTVRGIDDDDMEETQDEGDQAFIFTVSSATAAAGSSTELTGATGSTVTVTVTITETATEAVVVKNEVETVTTIIGATQVGTISGLIRTRITSPVSVSPPVTRVPSSPDTASALHLPDNPQDMGDMLNGLGLEHSANADGGGVYAVWARGTYTSMKGDPTVDGMKVDYDGDSTGIGIGAEKVTSKYVAGVAVNWLTTDLDLKSEDNEGLSNYEESLVMIAPYLALRRGNGRSFWISAGYGFGEADGTTAEDSLTASADVNVSFLNAGADFVITMNEYGELVGSLSALGVRKTVDAFAFEGVNPISQTSLTTFRGQGEVTYYRNIGAAGGRVRPYIGLATLHDAGDKLNDDSHALDLRGGGEFRGEKINASLEVSTELLREDHKSWSISGSARYLFSPDELGMSLTLDGSHATDSNMGLEGGYGMMVREVHKDALLTPFAGLKHGSGGNGEVSSGMRLAIGSDMDADLRAARRFSDDEDTLKLNFRRTF